MVEDYSVRIIQVETHKDRKTCLPTRSGSSYLPNYNSYLTRRSLVGGFRHPAIIFTLSFASVHLEKKTILGDNTIFAVFHVATCFQRHNYDVIVKFKGFVKRADPCKCDIRLVSRIIWHKRIILSLKEWRF